MCVCVCACSRVYRVFCGGYGRVMVVGVSVVGFFFGEGTQCWGWVCVEWVVLKIKKIEAHKSYFFSTVCWQLCCVRGG